MSSAASAADPVKDVFVFGSDLAGHHTGGEALVALRRHGAIYGRGVGLHRELTFQVSRIGCERGGYRDDEIAPLFKDVPPNCRLPRGWTRLIERRA
jgi:hypothetical protein